MPGVPLHNLKPISYSLMTIKPLRMRANILGDPVDKDPVDKDLHMNADTF